MTLLRKDERKELRQRLERGGSDLMAYVSECVTDDMFIKMQAAGEATDFVPHAEDVYLLAHELLTSHRPDDCRGRRDADLFGYGSFVARIKEDSATAPLYMCHYLARTAMAVSRAVVARVHPRMANVWRFGYGDVMNGETFANAIDAFGSLTLGFRRILDRAADYDPEAWLCDDVWAGTDSDEMIIRNFNNQHIIMNQDSPTTLFKDCTFNNNQIGNNNIMNVDTPAQNHNEQHNTALSPNSNATSTEPLTLDALKAKLDKVEGLIESKKMWFVVCKYMMLEGLCVEGDFRSAVAKLETIRPGLQLDAKELSKHNVLSFCKSVDKWDENDAPIKNKTTFNKYKYVAESLYNC